MSAPFVWQPRKCSRCGTEFKMRGSRSNCGPLPELCRECAEYGYIAVLRDAAKTLFEIFSPVSR